MPSSNPSFGRPAVLQIVGYKNSGKTTLVTSFVRRLKQAGLSVGTVKHDAHDFTIDTSGTDTWRHQEAGADVTAISSSRRSAVLRSRPEPLDKLLSQMPEVDIVLVEGFKQEPYPKLVLVRRPEDAGIVDQLSEVVAVAAWPEASYVHAKPAYSDEPVPPVFTIDDLEGIWSFLKPLLFP